MSLVTTVYVANNPEEGTYVRHRALNETVKRFLNSAGFPSTLEPLGLFRNDGKRADGVTIIPWKNGCHLVWDCTVVDFLCDSYFRGSTREKCFAASQAEDKKFTKYHGLSDEYLFHPLGFECLGSWGPSAHSVISDIGRKIKEETEDPRSTQFISQRISIEIQQGNAISILSTLPVMGSGEEFLL